MDNIINGKYFAQEILSKLEQDITSTKDQYNLVPTLAIILVGNDSASSIYVRNKLRTAAKIGMNSLQINLPDKIQSNNLLAEINKLNDDSSISGIIVQLPVPQHIDQNIILSAIDLQKDVDGFHPINVGYLHSGAREGFIPCTALGCLELIKRFESNLTGTNVVIVGRSNIVGKPLSALLLNEDCTVTLCHSKTKHLSSITSKADIVVSAIGSPGKLTQEYFHDNAIVIDVGITKLLHLNRIVGDVDFTNVADKVRYITPVPGGVGPMTVACLLRNTFKAMLRQHCIALTSDSLLSFY